MSRWIDADALIESVCHTADLGGWIGDTLRQIKRLAVRYINEAPSIDIVRCGECKWSKPYSDKQLKCNALGLGGLKFPDDFCSYGSRSEKPNNSKERSE